MKSERHCKKEKLFNNIAYLHIKKTHQKTSKSNPKMKKKKRIIHYNEVTFSPDVG